MHRGCGSDGRVGVDGVRGRFSLVHISLVFVLDLVHECLLAWGDCFQLDFRLLDWLGCGLVLLGLLVSHGKVNRLI